MLPVRIRLWTQKILLQVPYGARFCFVICYRRWHSVVLCPGHDGDCRSSNTPVAAVIINSVKSEQDIDTPSEPVTAITTVHSVTVTIHENGDGENDSHSGLHKIGEFAIARIRLHL